MKIFKRILIILLVIILAGGTFFYFRIKKMMDPNNFVKSQVEKQYNKEKTAPLKENLDFTPFKANIDKMSDLRYSDLEKLIVGSNIDTIHKNITEKKFTIEDLVTFYVKRINKLDPKLNTIIELNPEALNIARKLDKENKTNFSKDSLYGIPVLLKDNIATKDKMHTSAGAVALKKSKPDEDAFIVKKLRNSNAIILGKANLSEWANYTSSNFANGFSALGGQTHNPYGKFDVGGSSSGSAASVASNLSTISVGSETAGSMIYPSSQNSVVGIKPSLGLLSRYKIIPIAEAQDTAGAIGKNVSDATILFNKMIGFDENDSITKDASKYEKADYTKFLDPNGLKGMNIGIATNKLVTMHYRDDEDKIIDKVIKDLKKLGANVKEIKLDDNSFKANYSNVLKYEYKKGVNDYLKSINNPRIKNLQSIIEYNKKDKKSRIPYGQDLMEKSQNNKITEKENKDLVISNRKITSKGIDDALKKNNVDVILTLSNYLSSVYAPAGYPAISVPSGYKPNGEPIGITLIGSKFQEGTLIKAAYSYEQGTKYRVDPKLTNLK